MSTRHSEAAWVPAVGALLVLAGAAGIAVAVADIAREGAVPGPGLGVPLTLAFLVSFVGAGMMTRVRRLESERSLLPAFAVLFLGGALGCGVAALVMGTAIIPVPLLVGAALITAGIWWIRERRIRSIVDRGRRAPAVFAEVTRSSADGTSTYEEVGYRIAFQDETGREREVTGKGSFRTSRLPVAGDPVTLWYDPERPRRHVVRLASDGPASRVS